MLVRQVALVSEHPGIDAGELAAVGAALQKQAARDLAPVWEVSGTVDVFPTLESVPVGYWPLVVTDRRLGPSSGIHLDPDGHPYALVEWSASWSLTASHECLEMLVDPSGNRTIASTSPDPSTPSGRVELLVEVCDPCEAAEVGYTIDGVLVSDFYTPAYLEPGTGGNARYSFNHSLERPRQVLPKGYLSLRDPATAHWFQASYFGIAPAINPLGSLSLEGRSAREAVNMATPQHLDGTRLAEGDAHLAIANARRRAAREASAGRAARLRAHFASRLAQRS